MWKKIDSTAQTTSLKIGMLLTQDPEKEEDIFEILQSNKTTNYITLIHANGKKGIKFLPAEQLIKKSWWLKEK